MRKHHISLVLCIALLVLQLNSLVNATGRLEEEENSFAPNSLVGNGFLMLDGEVCAYVSGGDVYSFVGADDTTEPVKEGEETEVSGGDLDKDSQVSGGNLDKDSQVSGGDLDRDSQVSGGDLDKDTQVSGGDLDKDSQVSGGDLDKDSQSSGGDQDKDTQSSGGNLDKDTMESGDDFDNDGQLEAEVFNEDSQENGLNNEDKQVSGGNLDTNNGNSTDSDKHNGIDNAPLSNESHDALKGIEQDNGEESSLNKQDPSAENTETETDLSWPKEDASNVSGGDALDSIDEDSVSDNNAENLNSQTSLNLEPGVVSVMVPQNLDFMMDPYKICNRGYIWSHDFTFCNSGTTSIRLKLDKIKLNTFNGAKVGDSTLDSKQICNSNEKYVRLQLIVNNEIINVSEEESSYEVVLKPGEEISFTITGDMSLEPDDPWMAGDVSISMEYMAVGIIDINMDNSFIKPAVR